MCVLIPSGEIHIYFMYGIYIYVLLIVVVYIYIIVVKRLAVQIKIDPQNQDSPHSRAAARQKPLDMLYVVHHTDMW
jgi:hypothetical protein